MRDCSACMIDVMTGFVPRASLQNGHAMTLYGWGNPRYFPQLPPPVRRYFDVARATRVVADCHWQAKPWTRPTIVLLHGLNGSSQAHYMRGISAKAFARGFNAVRLNQRNCGDTEHLAEGLFHSGLTADVAQVVHELIHVDALPAIAVAGYSLWRQPGAETRGRVRQPRAGGAARRRRGIPHRRNRGVHAIRSSEKRTSSTNGISCAI